MVSVGLIIVATYIVSRNPQRESGVVNFSLCFLEGHSNSMKDELLIDINIDSHESTTCPGGGETVAWA